MALAAGIVMLTAVAASAQQPTGPVRQPTMSMGELTPTPSMWFYQQQMDSYLNPRFAIRRAAEQRAAERDARIASRKWFGYSNSRPMAVHTPFTHPLSATWAGNGVDQWHWWGISPTHVLVDRPGDYILR